MNVVVTGSNGQLGSEFKNLKLNDIDWVFLNSNELDITNNDFVRKYFKSKKTDLIINCAAFTNVDGAEENIKQAILVNKTGVQNLVEICSLHGIKLIHYSTDYVFDGLSNTPYIESNQTNPSSIYGQSKLDGEKIILASNIYGLIIRTSWLYSSYGKNFVKTMIKMAESKNEIKVVSDQKGSPTFTHDLVKATLKILSSRNYKWEKRADVFHYSNQGDCSWYEFANEIFRIKKIQVNTIPVLSEKFETKVNRPKYSLLDSSKIKMVFDLKIPHWKESLKIMLN